MLSHLYVYYLFGLWKVKTPSASQDPATKSDEFMVKFQMAFEPPPHTHIFENQIANLL